MPYASAVLPEIWRYSPDGRDAARHLVGGAEHLGRFAVVPARLQRQHVGLRDVGLAGELLPDEFLAGLDRPPVHPRQQAKREHVLGALAVLLRRTDRLDGPERQRRHRDGMHDVVGQFVGLQRVRYVAHLRQVALGELVGVRDHHSAARQVADVGLERRRVHGDENIGAVAGGQDVVVGDLNLEGRDPGQMCLRGRGSRRGSSAGSPGRFRKAPPRM